MKKTKPSPNRAKQASSKRSGGTPPSSRNARVESKILSTLREHYKLGEEANKYCETGTVAQFAEKLGLVERTVRMRRAFARQYTQADFERLCALRRARSGLPLQSGHVTYLLTLKAVAKNPKEARVDFEQKAAKNDWSPAQLHAAIRRRYASTQETHGRTLKVETKPKQAVEVAIAQAVNWRTRSEVAYQLLGVPSGKNKKAAADFRAMIQSCRLWCVKMERQLDLTAAPCKKAKAKR